MMKFDTRRGLHPSSGRANRTPGDADSQCPTEVRNPLQSAPECGGDGAQNKAEGDRIVPAKRFTQVDVRKHGEDDECDDLLDDLQLVAGELSVANPVRGYLEAVLAKRNQPTHDDGGDERRRTVLQVPVPRDL